MVQNIPYNGIVAVIRTGISAGHLQLRRIDPVIGNTAVKIIPETDGFIFPVLRFRAGAVNLVPLDDPNSRI